MNDEKVRVSGELSRGQAAPVLPTINPDAEKAASDKKSAGVPAFVYVMYVFIASDIPLACSVSRY